MRWLLLLIAMFAAKVPAQGRPLRVVVDPGHGGESTGALGAYGVYEKTVTLAIASRLGRLLEGESGIVTFYTRRDDVSVSLRDRAELANAVEADVFISIHCNASTSPDPSGVETFYLGKGGADPEADAVAAVENMGADEATTLAVILSDLRKTGAQAGSAAFAEAVQRHLESALPETQSRHVRQARFAVLRWTTMPAIVVEVGFLTHPEEGLNLLLPHYQERIAMALRDAILEYARSWRW